MTVSADFLPDGYERARGTSQRAVRAEAERDFASKLANASDEEKRDVLSAIEREIAKRLDDIAPPDALY